MGCAASRSDDVAASQTNERGLPPPTQMQEPKEATPEEAAILKRAPPAWFDGGEVQLSPHVESEFDEGTGYLSIYYTLQYKGEVKWKSPFASSTSNASGARGDNLTVELSHDNRVLIMTTSKWSGRDRTNLKTSVFDVAELVG
mmetsp:Transcript_24464/g.70202  ORF Transcript_24464/g.70202 Transcript_24464/m.70202 type:complete len:143 (-) Transcript_24464:48-476(-)